MKARALAAAFAALWSTICAADNASHCQPEEQVVFSCNVGKKLVSFCASNDLSSTSGYLQYRFGPKNAIELSYPEKKDHPRSSFVLGSLMYSGGGGDYVKFSNGDFQYVVYSAFAKGWAKDGVTVHRGGKLVSSLECKNFALGKNGWAAVYKANLPKDKEGYEIP